DYFCMIWYNNAYVLF
nr:immunoglobulin light chain junction region [Macaca mulatta]MOY09450.1 immunoglobulin light chain junction region [Macaca mulatta]MOY09835.1 immunoglobulin light chain junction region [Macaca mulatta]